MKSKNVALMAIAVAFGLVAAFVTSRYSQTQAQVEMVKVLVASKVIPIGTIMDDKAIQDSVAWAEYPKDAVPPDAFHDYAELKGKKIALMKAKQTWFTPLDVSSAPDVVCPTGFKRQAVRMSVVSAVSGFISPGSHVDILGIVVDVKDARKKYPVRLMRGALVLSVDGIERKGGVDGAVPTINSVTIAVKDDDARLLKLFEDNGLSLVLLDELQLKNGGYDMKPVQGYDITLDTIPGSKKEEPMEEVAPPKFEKVYVARRTLKQNEKITPENINELVEELEVGTKLPNKAVINLSDLKNKYLTTDTLAGQLILEDSVSDKEVAKAPLTVLPPVASDKPKTKETWVMWVRNGTEQVKVVFEKDEKTGNWNKVETGIKEAYPDPNSESPKESPKDAPKPAQPNLDGTPKERVTE